MKKFILSLLILLAFVAPFESQQQGYNRIVWNITAQATSCTANLSTACATLTVSPDVAGLGVQLSGTFSATLQFEATIDGSNWVAISGTPSLNGLTVTSATATGAWQFPVTGLIGFRVRCSTFSSGLVQVVIQSGIGAPTINPQVSVQNVNPLTSQNTGANPTAVANATAETGTGDLTGNLFVRTGGPNQFTCYARGIANALADFTQVAGGAGCGSQTAAGLKMYLTDIIAASTTGTGGQFRLSYGTGAACVTTNTALFPANTSDTWNYPSNATGTNPEVISFNQPLVIAGASRLCVIGTATNTLNISVNGFVAP